MPTQRQNPLRGFRCCQCGRPLDDRNNWDPHREKFFCNVLCRDAYEHDQPKEETGLILVQ